MIKISFKFAWYDIWIGLFIDAKSKNKLTLYFCPLPTLLITVTIHRHIWIYDDSSNQVVCEICNADYRRMRKWEI